jgi:hypothetical protein
MRRGTMLVLSLLLASTAMAQGAHSRRANPIGTVFGVLTAPLGAVLGSGRHYRSRAARHRHRRAIAHRRARHPTAIAAPAAAGGAAVAAVTANPSQTGKMPVTTGSIPSDEPRVAPSLAPTSHYGTVGPLAWPGALDDVIGFALWPAQYGTRLGAHGIGDVLSTAFAPSASIAARTKQARADTTSTDAAAAACAGISLTTKDWPMAEIASTIELNDAQRAALDQFRTAINEAIVPIKSSCRDDDPNRGPVQRLKAMQNALWAVHSAAQLIRAPLAAFYATLTDDQKRKFVAPEQRANARDVSRSDIARMCDLPASADAPLRQIEQAIQPAAAQRASLEALQKKSGEMGQFLLASCLGPVAETPTQRLDAAANRLTAVIFAITNVNMALNDFTSRLSGEQKTRLDSIVR